MISNYLTIALRHLIKDKTFAFIHVFGLSIGLTAFVLILQYVNFELSFDHFHSNRDELYRVALERKLPDGTHLETAKNFPGLRKLLMENVPEVTAATGFYKTPANTGVLFKYKGKIFNETGGELNADSAFFEVFQSLLVAGDPTTALDHPHNIVLSQSMARKVFGDTDPIGQHLQMPDVSNGERDCVVTGILMDIPANSHLHANFIVPLQYRWPSPEPWKDASLMTYITLNNENDYESVNDRLNALYRRIEKINLEVMGTHSFLQPITSIHLSSHLKDELESNGSKRMVLVAALIALGILVIGWINYINLETARFLLRGREVGVRRIIGSAKSDLAVITTSVLPYFTYLTGIPVDEISWPRTEILLGSLIILLGGSVAVGMYPAVFLLKLNPVSANACPAIVPI
jgi:putative ABC transport system permease protein